MLSCSRTDHTEPSTPSPGPDGVQEHDGSHPVEGQPAGPVLDGFRLPDHWTGGTPAARREPTRLVEALRDAAATDAATAAAESGRGPTNDVERLLATVPVIEQSKGLLMGYYGIDAASAYDLLRRWSSIANIKLSQISEQLVAAAAQPAEQPFGAVRSFLDSLPGTLLRHEPPTGRRRVDQDRLQPGGR